MKDFPGKVAVVTGGAEGIGRALAEAAAARGMKVFLADIDAARLEQAIVEMRVDGAEVDGLRADVSAPSAMDELAEVAFDRFGAVHLVAANAGVACAKPAWETTPEDWQWVMGVNFYGVANAVRAFVPRMLAAGEEGHVLATASMAGLLSLPGMAAYNASKHGVVTLMEGLHHDLTLRGTRIGASVLCPGWVRTRIALSERNRTAGEVTQVDKLDPLAAKLAGSVHKAVSEGLDPADVARLAFEAIEAGRFYILTHGNSKSGVNARLTDILEDRVPTLVRL